MSVVDRSKIGRRALLQLSASVVVFICEEKRKEDRGGISVAVRIVSDNPKKATTATAVVSGGSGSQHLAASTPQLP